MAEQDEGEIAADRLEAALDRIAQLQAAPRDPAASPWIDPRVTAKLDNLIRALRTALDT